MEDLTTHMQGLNINSEDAEKPSTASQIPEDFINTCMQAMNSTFEEAKKRISPLREGFPKDVTYACEAAADISPRIFHKYGLIPKDIYFNLIKAKHNSFMIFPEHIANFSDASLSSLKKRKRKSIASDVTSTIQNTPSYWANLCYLDAKFFVNIFHVSPMEKNYKGPVIVNISRYDTSKNKFKRHIFSARMIVKQRNFDLGSESMPRELYTCPKTGLCYPPCLVCKTTKAKTKRCSKCVSAYYCSSKCQKEDWKNHKALCKRVASENNKTSE